MEIAFRNMLCHADSSLHLKGIERVYQCEGNCCFIFYILVSFSFLRFYVAVCYKTLASLLAAELARFWLARKRNQLSGWVIVDVRHG